MARLEPSHWVCFVLQGIFLTPFNSFKTWSNPIYSWELSFQFSMSNVFQMKLWSCRRILWLCFWRFLKGGSRDIGALVDCLCASWFRLSLLISSGGIWSCHHIRLVALFLGILPVPRFHEMTWNPFFLEGLLRAVSGNLLPILFFPPLVMEKVSTYWLSYIRRGFGCSHLFSCSVRGTE